METLIKAVLIRNMDEGNLPLVFKRNGKEKEYTTDCSLTELGQELVNTTICLASMKRNDDNVVTGEGHINKVSDYESWGGNFAKVQNFSDRVAFDNVALKARKYIVESKISLEYDKTKVVSPLIHKDNIQMLGEKSKAKKKFKTATVDKAGVVFKDMPYIYKDMDNFYQNGEAQDNSIAKEVVWLRKVSFKMEGMDNYLTTLPSWSDEDEYTIWASKEMCE